MIKRKALTGEPLRHSPSVQRALFFQAAGLVAYTWSKRPGLADRAEALEAGVWPEYNRHGDVIGGSLGPLREAFSDLQFLVADEAADEVVGEGHSSPASRTDDRGPTRGHRRAPVAGFGRYS